MGWLLGESKDKSEEEMLKHLDPEKEKNLAACVENDHCKLRLSSYLEGL
jgi:hypothetical protein